MTFADDTPGRVTELLLRLGDGDQRAADVLVSLVYEELRRIASRQLGREAAGHTLSPTGLVHEAYLRLIDQRQVAWTNRAQFFAIAARVMRRVLMDHARKVGAEKRGGRWQRLDIDDVEIAVEDRAAELIALDEALEQLATLNPRLSQVVECRFFGGMTEEETASALGITDRTVRRDWIKAKGFLHQRLPA
jgi:RNA polymerase sigma-70 factor, ECF subfamily